MKNAVRFLITAMALMSLLSACGKKNDDGAAVAETPNTACNIPGNTSCTPNQYAQFGTQLAPYTWQTYQWQNNGAFCGCPVNYRPVMNPQLGLSCAPETFFQNGNSFGGGYNQNQGQYPGQYQGQYPNQNQGQYQNRFQNQNQFQGQYNNSSGFQAFSYQDYYEFQYSQNGQVSSIPQVTYSPAVSGQNGNCFTQAASVCDTQVANSCAGVGAICRPSGGGSRLGFCTGGYSDAYYGSNQQQQQQQQGCYSRRWGVFSIYACGATSYYDGGYYKTGGGFGGSYPR